MPAVGVAAQDQADALVEVFVGKGRDVREEQVEAIGFGLLLQVTQLVDG